MAVVDALAPRPSRRHASKLPALLRRGCRATAVVTAAAFATTAKHFIGRASGGISGASVGRPQRWTVPSHRSAAAATRVQALQQGGPAMAETVLDLCSPSSQQRHRRLCKTTNGKAPRTTSDVGSPAQFLRHLGMDTFAVEASKKPRAQRSVGLANRVQHSAMEGHLNTEQMAIELSQSAKQHGAWVLHATPSLCVRGLEASVISSGWTPEQWHEFRHLHAAM
eukprot:CAMPEP_0170618556 /NCGR_PEP_ID=MMETSP0224-20130122/27022_1 /TAXON_ID=285029 /ORGANISM="Togula jolla, Strain CCCM 725" /LENGTH=222 /DNA_ID=CAMNT_0010944539 /DNA_START=22 /DNA_END=690 /DNA_ORIENTATION=-